MLLRIVFSFLLAAITLFAGMIFTHTLGNAKSKKYWIGYAAAYIALVAVRFVMGDKIHGEDTVASVMLEEGLSAVILLFAAQRVCSLNYIEATYLAAWGIVSYNVAREVFEVLLYFPLFDNFSLVGEVLFCEIGQVILLSFAWKILPEKIAPGGRLRVGPRQTTSAVTITILFLLIFSFLHSIDSIRQLEPSLLAIYVLLEIYSVSLLYIQVALFQKSAMQKELDTVQLLIRKQKRQYVIARQNIGLINRRCHDLKLLIYKLQREDPDEEMQKTLKEAEEAANIYDAVVKTGNDVVDTVLTDKSLLCEEEKIRISCVADGEVLAFMEPTDIYTIFDGAVDYAMAEVRRFADPQQRFIDLMVHKKNNFVIINIVNPIFEAKSFEDGIPTPRGKHADDASLSLKMIREILRRYDGIFNVEVKNGVMTLRIVIPVK